MRKTPVRHKVPRHKRKGKWVRAYTRGSGEHGRKKGTRIVRLKKVKEKPILNRVFNSWVKQIAMEDPDLVFEKVPILLYGNTFKNSTREKQGKLTEATVTISKKFNLLPGMLEVITKHEIRENLAFQNFAPVKEAHEYALSFEKEDLKKVGLSKKDYDRKTRALGFVP